MRNKIGIQTVKAGVGSAGVGFVVVPQGVDRKEYIDDCYRTNTLTINGGKGYGYFSGVHADINAMQNIEFPQDENNRGTPVIWVRDATSQLPVIVGVLRKQEGYYALAENQYRVKRSKGSNNIEVFLDANESSLDVNVIGDAETASELTINVTSANKDSEVTLNCDNKVTINSENEISLVAEKQISLLVEKEGEIKGQVKYELEKGFEIISEKRVNLKIRNGKDEVKLECDYTAGSGFKYKDEFNNEIKCSNGLVEIISKKINHSGGKEPMVLGDTLLSIMDELIKAIQAITVPTSTGPSGKPLNTASFLAVSKKLKTFLSQNSNLD